MRMAREERGYPVLFVLSWVLKVLAVIIAIAGIIGGIVVGGAAGVITVIEAIVGGIIVYALGDLILVVMDIEHNTFLTSQQLQSRVTPAPSEGPEAKERPAA